MKTRSSALLLISLALTLAACGSSSSSSSSLSSSAPGPAGTSSINTSASASPGAHSGSSIHVVMKNLAFDPKTIHAKVGQTVSWTNEDAPPHNVTYVSGPKFTSSSTLTTGQSFSLKLTQPGTIQYFCSIHPFMKATIVVGQ